MGRLCFNNTSMKYISEFADINNTIYKVEITTESGTNTENFTLGGNPFITQMDSDGKTIYAPIKSSGATIEMLTSKMPFEVYSGKTKGVKVTLTNTTENKVEWVGYVTPCAYDMGLDEEKEVVEIECVDGIAALKDMPYRSTSKAVDSFLNIVFKCLKRAGCYKNLYVTDNVQFTSSGTDSIMSKLRVSEANFFDEKDSEAQPDDSVAWSCYDVLFEVMQYMGYTLTTDGEDVYILDYDAMVKGRTKYFKYSLTGSSIGSPTAVTLSSSKLIDGDSHSENGAKITLDEVYNQVTVLDEFYEIDSLVDGLDSSKNYINITASYDTELKNWFKNNSRFYESEVFTVKNKAGEDESFFVTLTKADDGKIFFVVGKFYQNPLITTYHYNHNNNGLQNESEYNPMKYSSLWNGKGATVVGYFTKQIESNKYNQWRVDITSNWDAQSKEVKLQQFGQLANIANIGSKKLVNYVLCLNQDTNHIEHDKVKNYPYFKIKKSVPTIFGGDGGYIVIKGTVIRHYMYNAPFPMNGTVYRHGDTKKTSIYANEGYFWAQLKWGSYYWKNEGDYKTMGDWVKTPSYFKIYYGDPTAEHRVDDWQDKDSPFYNNCGSLWGVDENGYYVPTPPDGNLNGEVELTVFANKDTKGKWARNNKRDKKNSYSGYPPKVVLFKGLDITVGYSDDAMNEDAASADTYYCADNSTEDNVRQMEEIKFKICTFDNKTPSYSTVDYLDSAGRSQYLDNTYNLATRQLLRQEHHLVYKLVNQYTEPRAILEFNLKRQLNLKPYTILTNKTISGRKYIIQTISNDYRFGACTVEMIEKTDNYDAID